MKSAPDLWSEGIGASRHDRGQRLGELARDITGAAYLRGDFVLSSGMRSNYYFDKYLFETKPSILRRVCAELVTLLPSDVDRIAGPELGAVALAAGVSLESGLPFVIVRKGGKEYGTNRLVEGELYPGERVTVIEDVISTGAQALLAAQQVKRAGATVVGILGVIDREQGGAQSIEAEGYHFDALFRKRDLQL